MVPIPLEDELITFNFYDILVILFFLDETFIFKE